MERSQAGAATPVTRVLVQNCGSSSFKWTVFRDGSRVEAEGNEAWSSPAAAARAEQIRAVLARAPEFDVAGHRLTHGGTLFREAVVVDDVVRCRLDELIVLDPEHMSAALAGIDAVADMRPDAQQVASFDTAFHATMGEAAAGYGLPFEWTERWGLRRFGFHGLSVSYAIERTRQILGEVPARMIVCHLGAGSSLTAVADGRSIDTTMGFSPLEGLMMSTRSGSVDPGLLLHLQANCGIGVDELRETLTKRSGLLGVSGVSADLRQVVAAAESGSQRACVAYERFVLSIQRELGAMAAVLGGVDTIVFTGGIGENSTIVRRHAATCLAFVGVELSAAANEARPVDQDVSASGSTVRVLVIHSREDLAVLKDVARIRGRADQAS